MFDFDELDELEVASEATDEARHRDDEGAQTPEQSRYGSPEVEEEARQQPDGGDTEVDECLSEVWPDDVPNESSEALSPEAQAEEPEGIEMEDHGEPRPWEVMFSRVVIRERPALDARVVGICSRSELVFEVSGGCGDPNWVKLVDNLGFVLKDGRLKDAKLGMLVKLFSWPPEVCVPKEFRNRVFGALKDGWVRLHAEHPLLGPGEIRRLRKAGEDGARKACEGQRFDFRTYDDHFWGEVMSLVAAAGARHHHGHTELAPHNGMSQVDLGYGSGGASGSGGIALVSASGGPALIHGHVPVRGLPEGGAGNGSCPWNHNGPKMRDFGRRVTAEYAKSLVQSMKRRCLPCEEDAIEILTQAEALLLRCPTLVRLQVPGNGTLRIVGDVHGQYWDLLHIFESFGPPSPTNMYLFNGDLVDRGQFSVEVVLAVFTWKLAYPDCVHVNRGNHEAETLNFLFGFTQEVRLKYTEDVFPFFSRAFRALPLVTVVNEAVFVVHGGLSNQEPLTLACVARLERVREPQDGAALMTELLWSDPMDGWGCRPSPRGGGMLFGPDVTRRFCEDNGLLCVIRSHEMREQGYEWTHEGRCLTLFSAANYCGICGNLGAVCSISPRTGACGLEALERGDLILTSFEAHEPPFEAAPRAFGGLGVFA